MFYVSHKFGGDPAEYEKAAKITRLLQIADPDNCYICPLMAFSHIQYGQLGYDVEMALCLELLSKCEGLIVASEISEGVRREITYAAEHDIPIEFLNKREGV